MASRNAIPFLVSMMLLTGVCNTLLTKYQDQQCVRNCASPDPKARKHFEQPVIQTLQMFVGEMGCWLVVGGLALYRRYVLKQSPSGVATAAYEPIDNDDNTTTATTTTTVAAGDDDDDENNGGDEDGTRPDGASIQSRTALNNNKHSKNGHHGGYDGDGSAHLAGWRVLLLSLPAICDILGTTLMNAGLLLVAASIYQMTRGALVLFVGLFSVVFLRRRLHAFQWLSLVGVVAGVAVVGLAGAIAPDNNNKGQPPSDAGGGVSGDMMMKSTTTTAAPTNDTVLVIVGVLMIAGAQIFTATQFVLEEWILERSSIEPVRVVGWEGLFGFLVTLLGMMVLHVVVGRTEQGRYGPFDMVEGWRQFWENQAVFVSSLLIMISIGGFNFFGLSVTRSVSATARSTIDTCRTLFIWMVSLGLGWESFKWLQVLGFALLVYFTFLFNGIVRPPFKFLRVPDDKVPELLPEEPIEHL